MDIRLVEELKLNRRRSFKSNEDKRKLIESN
jgi:hypothetical protein